MLRHEAERFRAGARAADVDRVERRVEEVNHGIEDVGFVVDDEHRGQPLRAEACGGGLRSAPRQACAGCIAPTHCVSITARASACAARRMWTSKHIALRLMAGRYFLFWFEWHKEHS